MSTLVENQNFGDGRLEQMDVNYEPQVDEALPKADTLAKVTFYFHLNLLIVLDRFDGCYRFTCAARETKSTWS